MKITKTFINGLLILEPQIFYDERGYFFESFSQKNFEQNVLKTTFVQDNESSSKYGVLRGIHFQKAPYSQAKLVRVIHGSVLDVAVDLRHNSPTFGQHFAIELSQDNKLQFFIPRGFGHAFCVLSPEAIFQYKCDNYYHPEVQQTLLWNDPTLKIDWKIPQNHIILSPKDQNGSPLSNCYKFKDNLYE